MEWLGHSYVGSTTVLPDSQAESDILDECTTSMKFGIQLDEKIFAIGRDITDLSREKNGSHFPKWLPKLTCLLV
jgi:hypothetical protein